VDDCLPCEIAVLWIPGHRVLLDVDLAHLYGVSARALNQAVKRNRERFAEDFMFQLTAEEARRSRSQTVILNVQVPDYSADSLRDGRAAGGRAGKDRAPLAVTDCDLKCASSRYC
jgi:hypothetical protein